MVEQIKFVFDDSNEVIFRYEGAYGAKGETRDIRRKPTPEQMARVNQRNRENNLRRLVKANFKKNDLWCTLKYPAGTKKTVAEMKKDFDSFIRKMKRRYKKSDEPLKYIYRMERGSHGGLHIHFLVNRIPDADVFLNECWDKGRVWYSSIYEEGGFEKLAEYIVKRPEKQVEGQLTLDGVEVDDAPLRYGRSRNLKEPVKTVKKYSHWTMRAFLDGNMPKPSKGYVVDKDSVYIGVNPFTGLSYIKYTEYRLKKRRSDKMKH